MTKNFRFTAGLACIISGLILICLLAYRHFGTFIRGYDGQIYYAQLRSIVVDKDFDYENEITQLSPNRHVFNKVLLRTQSGKILTFHCFGWSVFTLPPFLLTHLICKTFYPDIASGYSPPYDIAFALWQVLIAAICIIFLARASLKLGISKKSTLWGMAGAIFATNAVYYISIYPIAKHAALFSLAGGLTYCAVMLFFEPNKILLWVSSSILALLTFLTCPTDMIFLIIFLPAVYKKWRSADGIGSLLAPCLIIAGVLAGAIIQLLVWHAQLGYWTLNPYAEAYFKLTSSNQLFDFLHPKIFDILFLPTTNGAWLYHPYYAIGMLGMVMAAIISKDHRSLWIAMCVSCFVYIYIHSTWPYFHGGDSFGNRFFVSTIPFIFLGAADLFSRLSKKRQIILAGLICGLILLNFLLIGVYIEKIKILLPFQKNLF